MATAATLLNALFPTLCVGCGTVLAAGERHLCISCLASLPRTGFSDYADNPAERMLAGRVPYEQATAMLAYRDGGLSRRLVHAMKFHGNSDLCLMMGRQLGLDLMRRGRFDGVEVLVPVPLHWTRRLLRGYNQSELICRGMAEVMHRPVSTGNLIRHRYTRKQSRQQSSERSANVEGAFRVKHPKEFENKHLLLVDDVLTTGATLTACADALASIPDLRVSVATLTMAGV